MEKIEIKYDGFRLQLFINGVKVDIDKWYVENSAFDMKTISIEYLKENE